jgi:hypothetical protein
MKILRRCFAEVAWLYQNDSRKATVITKPENGFVLKLVEKYLCLTSFGCYGVLLGTGGKKLICFVAPNCLGSNLPRRKPPFVNFVLHPARGLGEPVALQIH